MIEQLQTELVVTLAAADSAHKAATDDQSVAETQYDTLAIEQSYLAQGQSKRVEEIKFAIKNLAGIPSVALAAKEKIAIGSLVQLEKDIEQQQWLFLAPVAGGYRCHLAVNGIKTTITVITPQSPIGKAIVGKSCDDEIKLSIADKHTCDFIAYIL